MLPGTVLVVDDNQSAADSLGRVLRRRGYTVEVCHSGEMAIERMDAGGVDVVLTDLRMDGVDGLDVLRHARTLPVPAEVLVFTGYGTVETAVQALQLGARDFLTKPVFPDQVVQRLEQLRGAGPRLRVQDGPSRAARALSRQMEAVAGSRATLLLLGEPGSGRDQVARQVHQLGADSVRPFTVLAHPGRAATALAGDVGSLFLPNVDLLEPRDQVQLLQVLNGLPEERTPRLIASAGPDWEAHARVSPASQELYYRLAVLVLRVPALRERPDDIEALLLAHIEASARAAGLTPTAPTAEQRRALSQHAWPGNLRELAAVADRAVVFGADAFDFELRIDSAPEDRLPDLTEGFSLQSYLEDVERTVLVRALEQAGSDRTEMARLLGLERNTLRYKLKKYGLLDVG